SVAIAFSGKRHRQKAAKITIANPLFCCFMKSLLFNKYAFIQQFKLPLKLYTAILWILCSYLFHHIPILQ
ncbi:MAG: hypothetical protein LBS02_01355, partial [Hungatella sp.]|nr:hypothetical protein [Hungatella sp.]